MGPLRALLCFLGTVASAGAASGAHSVRSVYTAVWDPSQAQPQVTLALYMDDRPAILYNVSTRKVQPLVPWVEKTDEYIPGFWGENTQRAQRSELRMKRELEHLRERFNHSTGFLIWQQMAGCVLSKNGRREGYNQYSYNGRDFLAFNKETMTWTATSPEAQQIKRKWDDDADYSQDVRFYMDHYCPERLMKFVELGKESLLRRDAPVATLTRKAYYDGLETLLCRAHGFYPKEIDASWKRDGETWEQDTFRSGVLPNADGTYHTWISIETDPRDRDRYRCHVEHDGLPEPLVLAWEGHDFAGPLAWGIFAAVIGVLLMVAVGIVLYKQRRRETVAEEPEVKAPFPL